MAGRNYVFVSDLHLSEGFLEGKKRYQENEDFFYDDAFARFLEHLEDKRKAKRYKKPWRLVINGDFLENLQITTYPEKNELVTFLKEAQSIIYPEEKGRPDFDSIRFSPREKYYGPGFDGPKSVWKLSRIIDGHHEFFSALAEFLAAGNELVIIKGNHDPEFTYPEFRRYLVHRLHRLAQQNHPGEKVAGRIFFSPWFYYEQGLFYAEHGGQYDEANRYAFFLDPTMIYEKTGIRSIRFPLFGSSFVRYFFNIIEREVPFADNVRPQSKALWWIITRKPGFTFLHLAHLFICLREFLQKKVFYGFDLLALREKYKSVGLIGFPAFVFFSVMGLFLVRPKHRKEYRANKINNLREMNRLENTDGISWRDGRGTGSFFPLKELLRIHYNSFGKRSAAADDTGLDDLQQAFARKEGELDGEEKKTLETVIANIRAAAKAKLRIESFIIKWLDFIVLAAETLAFVGICLISWPLPVVAYFAFIIIACLSFYFFHDLKRYMRAKVRPTKIPEKSTEQSAERGSYLNKAAFGVAGLLGLERVRFVIFGHTHVAYARPMKEVRGWKARPAQWEINTGSWTPVFDERMMLRQNGDEFPFIQITTEGKGEPELELLHWNDELGEPQTIRYTGEC